MNKELFIRCSSEEEMNRVADQMMEKGYETERMTGVFPLPVYCGMIYKVHVFEKGKAKSWMTKVMEVLLLLFWGMFIGICLWSLSKMESVELLFLSMMICVLLLFLADFIIIRKSVVKCKI